MNLVGVVDAFSIDNRLRVRLTQRDTTPPNVQRFTNSGFFPWATQLNEHEI